MATPRVTDDQRTRAAERVRARRPCLGGCGRLLLTTRSHRFCYRCWEERPEALPNVRVPRDVLELVATLVGESDDLADEHEVRGMGALAVVGCGGRAPVFEESNECR